MFDGDQKIYHLSSQIGFSTLEELFSYYKCKFISSYFIYYFFEAYEFKGLSLITRVGLRSCHLRKTCLAYVKCFLVLCMYRTDFRFLHSTDGKSRACSFSP